MSDNNQPAAAAPDYAAIITAAVQAIAADRDRAAQAAAAAAGVQPAAAAPAVAPAAAAQPDAASVARERIKAIVNADAAKTRPGLANYMALETDLDAATAIAILGKSPEEAKADELTSALHQRMAQPGNAAGVRPEAWNSDQRPSLAQKFESKFNSNQRRA